MSAEASVLMQRNEVQSSICLGFVCSAKTRVGWPTSSLDDGALKRGRLVFAAFFL